ncbi:MAG: hypothetical protein HY868_21445 [Chloroflexi bacterium]|nr:hypothetical protein [Chloroflexota bacterium]
MKGAGFFVAGGATSALIISLIGILFVSGGAPFSPGSLSAAHSAKRAVGEFASHADFDARCELCHAPFRGPESSRCLNCHTDVHDQIATTQGIHGALPNARACATCHTEHKGRASNLTRVAVVEIPHEQFGFSLERHARDYSNAPMTCRACHTFANDSNKPESAAVTAACVDCHARHDAWYIAEHRRAMGEACLACHDGSARLRGFDHNAVFSLDGKHGQTACVKCHVNNRFRGTPRDCVQCHAEPAIHRGKYGLVCAACHTSAGWRPANLIRHPFPLDHSGRQSGCQVCHPANYASYTCYNCHEHEPNKITRAHLDANIREIGNCAQCHPTGKKIE